VDWVKTLRVAGMAEIVRRGALDSRSSNRARWRGGCSPADEEPVERRPGARRVLSSYFEVPLDAPLSDWMKEAPRHLMFILE
jgi:hypothetical protein